MCIRDSVKDTGFNNVAELCRPDPIASPRGSRGRGTWLAWLLLLIASAATGLAVYGLVTWYAAQEAGARHGRRRRRPTAP